MHVRKHVVVSIVTDAPSNLHLYNIIINQLKKRLVFFCTTQPTVCVILSLFFYEGVSSVRIMSVSHFSTMESLQGRDLCILSYELMKNLLLLHNVIL